MGQRSDENEGLSFPGNVLVAASGFIVTGAGWGLFGYLEGELTATSTATAFFAISALHFVVGVLIFSRMALAVPAGVFLASASLAFALFQPQYVLVFTDLVILVLLVLARGDVAAGKRAV